jgi:hypothetical protein
MRRLARQLFTLFSATSLLLCVAVCALWGRSYPAGERWMRDGSRRVSATFVRGCMMFDLRSACVSPYPGPWPDHVRGPGETPWPYSSPARWGHTVAPTSRWVPWTILGFGARSFTELEANTVTNPMRFYVERGVQLSVPLWFLAVIFAASPAVLALGRPCTWRHVLGLRRQRDGFCPACSYDLRASPKRCPQGGTRAR